MSIGDADALTIEPGRDGQAPSVPRRAALVDRADYAPLDGRVRVVFFVLVLVVGARFMLTTCPPPCVPCRRSCTTGPGCSACSSTTGRSR